MRSPGEGLFKEWLLDLIARRGKKIAAVALTNNDAIELT
jgi:hypothetical protein